ncbi:hypothetical protein [Saccharothrix violaceirubra]|uniref:Uncharacterized protein n=1 Tax=Saccharothrix violaceirubra TaxID=413306 RepID=A0A7W7WVG6_9PSEU|nr:hypothetical protein [Saccharothrix violaceirubra]MBB4965300.1 hypothetical protein [Saccharothrix violaceirubra]
MAHSIVVNRVLKPVREAAGELIGEAIADAAGATGRRRERIVTTTRRVVNVGGALATSVAMADAVGASDALDSFDD